jgi:hypothetical protein
MNSHAVLRRMVAISGIVSLLSLAGCRGGTASTVNSQPPAAAPQTSGVSISPTSAMVSTGSTQHFNAIVTPPGSSSAVTWSISGTGCTGESCGTIELTGNYTAPSIVPTPPGVTVTATSVADPSKSASATVTVMPPPPGSSSTVANLATARFRHEATLLPNGDVLITGGGRGKDSDHFEVTAQAELFDSVHLTFTSVGQVTRVFHTATLLRTGQVLLTGGDTSGFGTIVATAELYDPLTRQLQPTMNMTSEREFHTATLLADGRVLIAGGRRLDPSGNEVAVRTAEIYDPVTRTFSPTGSMNQPRDGHTSTLLADGRVLILGGYDSGPVLSAELYDPATRSFTATGSLIIQRHSYAATLLANGKVLITGGNDDANHDTTAELYDPAVGLFTTTGVMVTLRRGHTATLLPSGVVLVVGGANGDFLVSALASVELYNPVTGQFTRAADLQTGRFAHTATLLSDGTVLVVGGDNGDGFHYKPVSSAEILQMKTVAETVPARRLLVRLPYARL